MDKSCNLIQSCTRMDRVNKLSIIFVALAIAVISSYPTRRGGTAEGAISRSFDFNFFGMADVHIYLKTDPVWQDREN